MTSKNNAADDTIPDLGDSLARIDPGLGNPTRLGIVASLKNRDRAEFRLLRDSLGVSDSVLSRHITALESTGMVAVKKGYVGKRPRTWVSITDEGTRRLDAHVQALRELAGS
ncbi:MULTISPECIES: winged helix-turn-helix domain-containing protein [unclassified Brevibacterium]|uniref:winged helix-turn-helix domain-containing protein n=1 Tax=unclassified Brevibacterium TaxID=2614124 RepID=UPI00107FEAD7|nr:MULTISPECIES: transcriptional regulator [unclassified Brevibacterium]TGD13665.1 ArsR family transcriptional regulator [Brevibacterium sp. S111]TGD27985.1 ArsR family transcriptional regulator [Brevibacterium sp. S22]